MMVKGCGEVF